jgi:hypothetical protein
MIFVQPKIKLVSLYNCLNDLDSSLCHHFGLEKELSSKKLKLVTFEEPSLVIYFNHLVSKKMEKEEEYFNIEYNWEAEGNIYGIDLDEDQKDKFYSIFDLSFEDFVDEMNLGWMESIQNLNQDLFFIEETQIIGYDFDDGLGGRKDILFYLNEEGDFSDELNSFIIASKILK